MPNNLRVPRISASSSDVFASNRRSSTYFEDFFALTNSNLYDDGVIVFAHSADPAVFRLIYDWTHTEDFYVAEDWFGMNDLNL